MKRVLALALIAVFMSQSIQAQAAPTVASVQRDVDRLRTLAAEKYEAANEATIRIRALQKETGALESTGRLLESVSNYRSRWMVIPRKRTGSGL